MNQSNLGRSHSLDVLKFLCSILVIFIHVNFASDINLEINYYVVNGLSRIAVPIFFLLSGFYFYSMSDEKRLKWLLRNVRLYLYWSIVYSYFWFNMSPYGYIENAFYFFFGYYHLWFLPALVYAAIIVHFLQKCALILRYMVFVVTAICGVSLQYTSAFELTNVSGDLFSFSNYWIYRNFLFFGLPFFLLGVILNEVNASIYFENKLRSMILVVFAMILFLIEVMLLKPYISSGLDLSFMLYFLCAMIFLFVYNLHKKYDSHIIGSVVSASTGLYFLHPLVLMSLKKVGYTNTLFLTFVCIAICLLFSLTYKNVLTIVRGFLIRVKI